MLIQLKRSANTGNGPVSLANGELALNFSDQLLYYKHANGAILTLANGQTIGIGTDAYARVRANAAFEAANIATPGFSQAAYDHANGAFSLANTDFTIANSAYAQANLANTVAASAYNQANTANTTGTAAYAQANTATTTGQAAFDTANGAIFTAAQIRANVSNTYPIYYNATTGTISLVPATANGQLLIGNTVSGSFDVNALTPGSNVTIVIDKGSITISANTQTDQFARDQANFAFSMAVVFG